MIQAKIDGIEVQVEKGTTILDAARNANIRIPTLCKHEDLPPTAACGLCVVQNRGSDRMMRACCTTLDQGMDILTSTPEIVEVRRNVLELILSAHPNDCLRCGRNTDCELQRIAAEFGIREQHFDPIVPDIPRDESTGAIVLDPAKCIKCGRCLYVCQQMQNVWALSFLERGIDTRMAPAGDISLKESPCVGCGQCSAHCPTGAIFEADHTRQVWEALRDPTKHCIVQIAPAVRVSIGEAFGLEPGTLLTKKTYAMLRRLGFKAVFDTNFGADVTIMEEASEFVERMVRNNHLLPLITTCCPAWVDFMEKFYPDMIYHFSSCKSPQEMLGVLTKTYYAERMGIDPANIYMVSVMPCTAKKQEIRRSAEMHASGQQDVDVVITSRELGRMIKQAGIDFLNLPEEEADQVLGTYTGAGTIFGATGGVMEAALRTACHQLTGETLGKVDFEAVRGLDGVKEATLDIGSSRVRVAVAHGLGHVETVLKRVREAKANGDEPAYHFIEVMACPGGCVGGGGQNYGVTDAVRAARARGLYEDDATQTVRCSHENPFVQELYRVYLGHPRSEKAEELLHTAYKPRPVYSK